MQVHLMQGRGGSVHTGPYYMVCMGVTAGHRTHTHTESSMCAAIGGMCFVCDMCTPHIHPKAAARLTPHALSCEVLDFHPGHPPLRLPPGASQC